MFRRVILDNWMAIFPAVAFLTALSVYVCVFYKTLRMRRPQVDHFSKLPFND